MGLRDNDQGIRATCAQNTHLGAEPGLRCVDELSHEPDDDRSPALFARPSSQPVRLLESPLGLFALPELRAKGAKDSKGARAPLVEYTRLTEQHQSAPDLALCAELPSAGDPRLDGIVRIPDACDWLHHLKLARVSLCSAVHEAPNVPLAEPSPLAPSGGIGRGVAEERVIPKRDFPENGTPKSPIPRRALSPEERCPDKGEVTPLWIIR